MADTSSGRANSRSGSAGKEQKPPSRKKSDLTVDNIKKLSSAASGSSETSSKKGGSKELGPVRTIKSASKQEGSVHGPESQGNVEDSKSIALNKPKPLPPIGKERKSEEHDSDFQGSGRGSPASSMASSVTESSMSGSAAGSGPPRIISYRRELSNEEENEEDEEYLAVLSERKNDMAERAVSPATREVSSRRGIDGKMYVAVTIDTQTDWTWLNDMKRLERTPLEAEIHGKSTQRDDDKEGEKSSPGVLERAVVEKARELESQIAAAPIPHGANDDLYGIPMLDIGSESEDSEEDVPVVYNDLSDGERDDYFPSVGPPQILQYIRESEKVEDGEEILQVDTTLGAMPTPKIPTELPNNTTESPNGICEFCSKNIKQWPSLSDMDDFPSEVLFCCDDYKEFVKFTLSHPLNEKFNVDTMIDVAPHAPFGSKKARRAAKERAAERMRQRELQRQQQAAAGLNVASNFYSFARQMKTITYSLASQRCLDEGWTVRPPTPPECEDDIPEVFEPEPILPNAVPASIEENGGRAVITKFYQDGKKFLILFPDGTGNVFYPSGRVAVSIIFVELGQNCYILHDDTEDRPKVLATFDPTGFACCYYGNGNIRLYLDQFGGTEHDIQGGRKRRWDWNDVTTHVHAPPFQPIVVGLNKNLGLRVMSQENIAVTFTAKKRSCRFNVGAKLKLVNPSSIPDRDIDDDIIYISEVKARVEVLMDKVANLLKFPNSPKVSKITPPLNLTQRIQRTERLKQDKAASLEKEKDKKGIRPIVSVN